MKHEGQRRFLLSKIPDGLNENSPVYRRITTHYLYDNGMTQVYITESNDNGNSFCTLTEVIEFEGEVEEITREIHKDVYKILPLVAIKGIAKDRYVDVIDGCMWIIDRLFFEREEIIVAKVTQNHPKHSVRDIKVPKMISDVLIREVTDDLRYKSENLTNNYTKI